MLASLAFAEPAQKAETPSTSPAHLQFFENKIRPVLVQHCYKCHSADAVKKSGEPVGGGLFLDNRAAMQKGGQSGELVVAGKPEESLLIQALRWDGVEMPPDEPLPKAVVNDFVKWIADGAADPRQPIEHSEEISPSETESAANSEETLWSFEKRTDPPLPKVNNEAWPRDPLDRFVLAKLEAESLTPSADADPRVLVRRLYYDLLGLPPTADQVDAFVAAHQKSNQQATAELVDHLLAQPQFGERWGRHWLDVARYGESNGDDGLGRNATFPHAWRYRDWVIEALNRDLPYDDFLKQQIAGDLLPAESAEERNRNLVATGFLAIGSKPAAAMNSDFAMDIVDDQINVVTKGLLGLSVACARCHDHKHDPIPTRDYYALAGIFTSTQTLYGAAANEKLTAPPTELHVLNSAWKPEDQHPPQQIAKLDLPAAYDEAAQKLEPAVYARLHAAPETGLNVVTGAAFSEENFAAVKDAELTGELPELMPETMAEPAAEQKTSDEYSVSFWFKNDLKNSVRPITAYLFSRAQLGDTALPGDHLGIGGTHDKDKTGKLFVFNGNAKKQSVGGNTVIPPESWNHVVLVRRGNHVTLYLNGNEQPEIDADLPAAFGDNRQFSLATRSDKFAPLQGNVAGFAIYPRSLSAADAKQLHVASGQPVIPLAPAGEASGERLAMGVREAAKPADTKIHIGGLGSKLGEAVPRGFLSAYKDDDSQSNRFAVPSNQSGRLQLADWLTQPDHPHTARVMVNRVWLHLMGRGIVATPDDFGVYGARPTHPQLLDHLAERFVSEGWSVKQLIRNIVLSRTYGLSSLPDAAVASADPENIYYAYHSRRRLDAEELRDSLLRASGRLDLQPAVGSDVAKIDRLINWPPGEATDLHLPSQHRSVYLCMLRHAPPAELAAFDLPDGIDVVGQRPETTLPTQPLFLLNSPLVQSEAAALAENLLAIPDLDPATRVKQLYLFALQRTPTDAELQRSLDYLQTSTANLEANQQSQQPSEKTVWASLCQALFVSNEFRYID